MGRITVYSYGAMLALAFILTALLASKRSRVFNIPEESVGNLVFVLLVAGLVGARALYVLLNATYFSRHPVEVLFINRGGLVFYGGFISALAAGFIFARIHKMPILDTDLLAPFVALGHAIGRIGCFLNGCCYGKPTSSGLGIVFPYSDTAIYPTQLFSSAGLFIIFIALFFMQGRRRFKGEIFSLYLISYGALRFLLEFLRGDVEPLILWFGTGQLISIGLVAAGLWLYAITKRQP